MDLGHRSIPRLCTGSVCNSVSVTVQRLDKRVPHLFPLSLSLSLAVSVKNSRLVFTLDSRPAVFGAPPAASCAATTDRSAPFFLSPSTPAAHRATRYSLTNRLIYGEYSLHLNKKIKKIKPTKKKIQKTKKNHTHTQERKTEFVHTV